MHIPDPIERMESAAERHYDEMIQPDGMMLCIYCKKHKFKEDEGHFISPNPYAMPACDKCAEESGHP